MRNFLPVILVALFGALGALARWGVSGWAYQLLGQRFAWGTLAVNLLGCFLLGFVAHVALVSASWSPQWRTGIGVGFLGAFTTFSTFGYETVAFLERRMWLEAAANVAANVVLGILLVWLGLTLARAWYGP